MPTHAEEIAAAEASAPVHADPLAGGAVGRTMFDLPGSADLGVTVLLPDEKLHAAPSQSLVRIVSPRDKRSYLGVVSAGPFAEPDGGLRGDSPILKAVSVHGADYAPPLHGRVQVTLLGEELSDGTLAPPRLRPVPNSPVFVLDDDEAAKVLGCCGGNNDVRLGLAAGHDSVEVAVPSASKAVFPRHTAILGTTGGGKSNTVAGLVKRATDAGMAVIVLDVEGEYTRLNEPADDPRALGVLRARGLEPAGVAEGRMTNYYLAGREPANPGHPSQRPFTVQFAGLSPYAVMEILALSEAQQERFLKAYDVAKEVMRDLCIFPAKGNAEQERMAAEIDEFERGHPRLTLGILLDVVGACAARAASPPASAKRGKKTADDLDPEPAWAAEPRSRDLASSEGKQSLMTRVNAGNPPGNAVSWRALLGRLGRLNRLKVFYDEAAGPKPIGYKKLLKPGQLSVIDLSDAGYSELSNIVIADLLRGVQAAQDELYTAAEAGGEAPPRVLVVIEEAHEFLSQERADKSPVLFEQLARIAKRGRKRWLGLAFVTQLPGHLPKQVLGLCNSFILHKLTDPSAVSMLRRTVAGVDEGLWDRLPGLAPGQAVAAFPHFARPMLVGIDPAPGKLRLID